jgi:hypothetical protein
MTGEPMELEKEQQTFARELPTLLPMTGKFALIQGDAVIGAFDAYADALKVGYDKFGVKTPFLVKQIQAVERAQFFTRDMAPCRT